MSAIPYASHLVGNHDMDQNSSSFKRSFHEETNLMLLNLDIYNFFFTLGNFVFVYFPLKLYSVLPQGFCSDLSWLYSSLQQLSIYCYFYFSNLSHYSVNSTKSGSTKTLHYLMSFLFYHQYLEICFSIANTEMKESILKNEHFMENSLPNVSLSTFLYILNHYCIVSD